MNLKKYLKESSSLNEYVEGEKEFQKSIENVNSLSLGLILKQYVYSFLFWVYSQNPEYAEYLDSEELTNYFLHKVNHPFWFVLMCEELIDGFDLIIDINDSIDKYFGESIFDYVFNICSLDKEGVYQSLKPNTDKRPCQKLISYVKENCSLLGIEIPEDDITFDWQCETEAALRVLLAVKKERENC